MSKSTHNNKNKWKLSSDGFSVEDLPFTFDDKNADKYNSLQNKSTLPFGENFGFVIFCGLGILVFLYFTFINNKKSNSVNKKSVKQSECYVVPNPAPWNCKEDCSGHQAGYNWAANKNMHNSMDCAGNSQSFIEGCEYYIQAEMHDITLDQCLDKYSDDQILEYEKNRDEEYRFEP
jgi:hypothetical protein